MSTSQITIIISIPSLSSWNWQQQTARWEFTFRWRGLVKKDGNGFSFKIRIDYWIIHNFHWKSLHSYILSRVCLSYMQRTLSSWCRSSVNLKLEWLEASFRLLLMMLSVWLSKSCLVSIPFLFSSASRQYDLV